MFSLPTYKAIQIPLGILMCGTIGCNNHMSSTVTVSPKHFKVETPFMLSDRGIIINTYWGSAKTHHVLCIDNNSPSWIKSSIAGDSNSLKKEKKLRFETTTADGSHTEGNIGICDSLFYGNVLFRKIPFYIMPYNQKDNNQDDGVFGIDAMSKGIWKIDFKNDELSFASSIDSFSEITQTQLFPATFRQHSIVIAVDFGINNMEMAVDLGYNGDFLMPLNDFHKISISNKAHKSLGTFKTPVSENIVNSLTIFDTVNISNNQYLTIVSFNDKVKERLIGLAFFKRFDFVIFDFINQRIYIPKTRM